MNKDRSTCFDECHHKYERIRKFISTNTVYLCRYTKKVAFVCSQSFIHDCSSWLVGLTPTLYINERAHVSFTFSRSSCLVDNAAKPPERDRSIDRKEKMRRRAKRDASEIIGSIMKKRAATGIYRLGMPIAHLERSAREESVRMKRA